MNTSLVLTKKVKYNWLYVIIGLIIALLPIVVILQIIQPIGLLVGAKEFPFISKIIWTLGCAYFGWNIGMLISKYLLPKLDFLIDRLDYLNTKELLNWLKNNNLEEISRASVYSRCVEYAINGKELSLYYWHDNTMSLHDNINKKCVLISKNKDIHDIIGMDVYSRGLKTTDTHDENYVNFLNKKLSGDV